MNGFLPNISERLDVKLIETDAAKQHLRVDHDDDDAEINRMVRGVATRIETYLRRFLITATIEQKFAAFTTILPLQFPPISEIVSVEYYNPTNQVQTLPAEQYEFVNVEAGSGVCLLDGYSWPAVSLRSSPITVTYKCGFGETADKVPNDIIDAAFLLLSESYDGGDEGREMAETALKMLKPYRVFV